MAYKIDQFIINGFRSLSPALHLLNKSSEIDDDGYVIAYCKAINSLLFIKKIFKHPDLYNNNTENGHFLKFQTRNICPQDYKFYNLKCPTPEINELEEESINEEESSDSIEKSILEFDELKINNHDSCECLKLTSELIKIELIRYIKMFGMNEYACINEKDSDIFEVINFMEKSVVNSFEKKQIFNKIQKEDELYDLFSCFSNKFGEEIAVSIFKHCPMIDLHRKEGRSGKDEAIKNDLYVRAEFLYNFQKKVSELSEKYKEFDLHLNDPSHNLYKLIKEITCCILFYPDFISINNKEESSIVYMNNSFVLEAISYLIKETNIDCKSAEKLLEVILKRCSFHPTNSLIRGQRSLIKMQKIGMQHTIAQKFSRAQQSSYKDIYCLFSKENSIVAKYKPIPFSSAIREIRGYQYDTLLGLGMTPPTGHAQLSIKKGLLLLKEAFERIEKKLKISDDLKKSGEISLSTLVKNEAVELHNQALKQFSYFPAEIKNGLYLFLSSSILGYENIDNGEKYWFNTNFSYISNKKRAESINLFVNSSKYQEFSSKFFIESNEKSGTTQLWINGSKTFDDLMFLDADGGKKIKNIPESLVHLHCILGIVKGSGDGHTGNSIAKFSKEGLVESIYEIDDERTLLNDNKYTQLRMWQFGLPQADLPFNRTILFIFSQKQLLKQICAFNRSDRSELIFKDSYRAQEERVGKLITLFHDELQKNEITLTPRKLFFEILGGEEKYNQCLLKGDLNPWEIFEFHMGDDNGVGKYFDDQSIAQNNFNVLYDLSIEEICKNRLRKIQKKHPNARLVVKFDTGLGNALFIKGSLPAMNWEGAIRLKNIDKDTWIFESEVEIEQGEYQIYMNQIIKEKSCDTHKIESSFQSKIVFVDF